MVKGIMAAKPWNTVAIIGVGLLGGSVGLALHARSLAGRIVGIGRNADRLRKAKKLGAVTEGTTNLAQGVKDADLVVVCTPIDDVVRQVRDVRQHCPIGAIITDVASTKTSIVTALDNHSAASSAKIAPAFFIGSHPIAGSDKTGVENSRADMFVDRAVVVTPQTGDPKPKVAAIEKLWKSLGARVFRMTPREHDEAVAAISHLPHAIASVLAAMTPAKYLPLVAGGWLDTTRVAAGDVDLWRQILLDNRLAVAQSMHEFTVGIQALRNALAKKDSDEVVRVLQAGKKNRDAVGN